ncbi:alpha-ketoglutarate-dependent dioxygenase AlkB [Sinorhizobium meliloti]|uniref:alpha-ketoglutarate-dependent dioxygenase AlkB n=1 Tax=Rhizobium meliloti TaxID=382 RepID=UPI000FD7E5D5|nr:alpha-ketoglutarate-dependent dioxygenase AlkB [Sinorhizobium meliloti]MDW9366687.1 alpha-ketoglutarate-dependent dioxygenase AlkB [Sinorhizobium meliloti]MDW9406909.1 alpha-ketoglutarate-dependent dioxygenase AlkB [Sinorhizobium meliloti]MDW9452359.1 alpha-ketoglutarate-dependent dioxygenase AlkB [Sinorhizobium meliloti]MDW9465021.1 alpha-ketoglutarate-dependent dioxygenase AlkB [Sinorhizobium meliloti]MDW9553459.1 alpha-ketoglutarate-dependent dioxygenase AlkB [Sinorhizobium meliloti]
MQGDLFGNPPGNLPEGFRYQAGIVPRKLQEALLEALPELPFKPFDFHGYEGKRRVVSFGWKYDFDTETVRRTDAIPPLLLPLRQLAADFAGLPAEGLQQALVTEYDVGAPIGWHRDKAVFGDVVGISLLTSCTFRLRRKRAGRWERTSVILEPGSGYLLSGAARSEWEHSIPPVERLRYSVTFRELRSGIGAGGRA